jgi:hypothetical protein
MFKVSPANLETYIDTPNCALGDRVQYSTVHIPNVFCDGQLKLFKILLLVFCTVIIRHTETFLSPSIRKVVSKFQRHMARLVLKLQNNETCLLCTIVKLVEDAQEEITNSNTLRVNLVTGYLYT